MPILNSSGKIDSDLIPALTVSNTFTAANETEMLALDAKKGDVCIRTDTNETYILTADDPKVIASWTKLLAPTDAVQSVNGKTGVVVLTPEDIGAISKDGLGESGGMATLDENGKVPVDQLLTETAITDNADAVPTSAAVFAHIKETNAHEATATPTADRIAMFDGGGKLKSSTPTDADDVATKGYVDSISSGDSGKFRSEITGDGTKRDFTVNHNLRNGEVGVRIFKNVSGVLTPIFVQWSPTTEDQIRLSFAVAPATTDQFVVKIFN